jgi:ABC-2 type transport system permease protein
VSALAQMGLVARRSVRRTLRQPALVVPNLVFPLVLLAVNGSGLEAATDLPGFPVETYLDFALAVAFIQAALFAAITAGTALAADVQSGFLDRLQLTPLTRLALLAGQLAGAMVLVLMGAVTYLAVGVVAGVEVQSGALGLLAIVAYALLMALAFAGIGQVVGLRTGSPEAVQGVFPLFFALLFLSSSNLPRPLLEQDWFRAVATYNPVSYLVEGVRSLVITGWDAEALALGVGCTLAVAVVAFAGASAALRTRMART